MSAQPTTRIATAEEVLRFVVDASGVARDEIVSRSRMKSPSRARTIAAHILRNHCHMSYPEIGRVLGRDHTTIMYAVENIQLADPHVKTIYDRVMKSIGSVTEW